MTKYKGENIHLMGRQRTTNMCIQIKFFLKRRLDTSVYKYTIYIAWFMLVTFRVTDESH